MEVIATGFLVAVVLKAMRTRGLPEYIRGLLIGSAYFVATSATQVFSQGGNNFAKVLPKIILASNYVMIFWFLLTSLLGFVLGFSLFSLMQKKQSGVSKIQFEEHEAMEKEEDEVQENSEEEIKEE